MDLDEVYQDYAQMLYRYIYRLCRDRILAEDILQTTFLKAILHADSYRGDCMIFGWLCRIAKNTYLDHLKKKENANISLEESAEAIQEKRNGTIFESSVEHAVIQREQSAELKKAIRELDEPYREVLMLRIYGEFSFREIGRLYEKSDSWARVIFFRGKQKVLDRLDV